ncbi:hypothetical protein MACH26_01960 [Planctobacterium marinum]|uniref:Uncharacterized protein n=1 Tax=Planctobacterium marinum TaxID=1631968 RepID=A0AA48HU82_9ALTE|nr:hypothetical protein MACH26_01960 [Planctobacterium marinum]
MCPLTQLLKAQKLYFTAGEIFSQMSKAINVLDREGTILIMEKENEGTDY